MSTPLNKWGAAQPSLWGTGRAYREPTPKMRERAERDARLWAVRGAVPQARFTLEQQLQQQHELQQEQHDLQQDGN